MVEIPASEGQLGLTINELLDFSYLFDEPAFLAALAARGIDDPNPGNILVTPLTSGSFALPEESRRIVKAQMYYTEGAASNIYGRPIEGLQVIIDLDDQEIVEILDTGVVPVPSDVPNYASGETPNQNPKSPGLPRYVLDNQNIIDTDIVVWHTLSFHHITAAEDFPVLTREHGSFELLPLNFFDRNPSIDLRRAPFEVDQNP